MPVLPTFTRRWALQKVLGSTRPAYKAAFVTVHRRGLEKLSKDMQRSWAWSGYLSILRALPAPHKPQVPAYWV